jgi:dimethylaniline monooxygenase (N-oxide forming)
MSKRIAIIGAGPAGLVAAKSCLEYGVQPVIFEKSPRLGGVWSHLAWQGMHTNLSKWSCMFSDFPWPDDMQDFPLQSDVEQYLHRYADKFGITQFIRLNTEVTSLNQAGNKRVMQDNDYSEEFDGVIIASGFFSKPMMPKFSSDDDFNSKIIHSAYAQPHLHNPDKRVVVYGGSFSGYELAAEFAKVSKYPVTHLFQRPSWVVRRYVPQPTGREIPVDFSFYSRKNGEL